LSNFVLDRRYSFLSETIVVALELGRPEKLNHRIGAFPQEPEPIAIVDKKFWKAQQRLIIVDQETQGIDQDPFHARSPTLAPYGLEGSNGLRRDESALLRPDVAKDIETEWELGRVEVDAVGTVGNRLGQIAVRIEQAKAAVKLQD